MSSAIFFHREISMFFKHYVQTGEESVFGCISQYFGAVETNEHGALHIHGLLWLDGNMNLSSTLQDVVGDDQTAYWECVIQYVDSVFTEVCSLFTPFCCMELSNMRLMMQDLDQEAFSAVHVERSVTSDISSLLQNSQQFTATFNEEANFCASATQIHTHTPTCVKYSMTGPGRKQDLCWFKAPWKLVEKTAFTADGVLQIRHSHPMVNQWNKAIAVGLWHNHDISFIATQQKTMAIIFYVTNYVTKVEDPVSKRVAAAADIFHLLDNSIVESQAVMAGSHGEGDSIQNRTWQFLMKVANQIFTEQPLSQVEVIAHLLGYEMEFTNNNVWKFVNVSGLYWDVF
jgi:hypothetical protein